MKNKKMTLSKLKVQSFITDMDLESSKTAKGGWDDVPSVIICPSDACETLLECITKPEGGCPEFPK